VIDSLQNEIRECYVHIGIDGYGRDRGYGSYLGGGLYALDVPAGHVWGIDPAGK